MILAANYFLFYLLFNPSYKEHFGSINHLNRAKQGTEIKVYH